MESQSQKNTTPKGTPILAIIAYIPTLFVITALQKGKDEFFMNHAKTGALLTAVFVIITLLWQLFYIDLIVALMYLAWLGLAFWGAFKASQKNVFYLPFFSKVANYIPLEKLTKTEGLSERKELANQEQSDSKEAKQPAQTFGPEQANRHDEAKQPAQTVRPEQSTRPTENPEPAPVASESRVKADPASEPTPESEPAAESNPNPASEPTPESEPVAKSNPIPESNPSTKQQENEVTRTTTNLDSAKEVSPEVHKETGIQIKPAPETKNNQNTTPSNTSPQQETEQEKTQEGVQEGKQQRS